MKVTRRDVAMALQVLMTLIMAFMAWILLEMRSISVDTAQDVRDMADINRIEYGNIRGTLEGYEPPVVFGEGAEELTVERARRLKLTGPCTAEVEK